MNEQSLKEINKRILTRLREERGSKYKGILRGLALMKPVFAIQSYGNFVEAGLRSDLITTFYVAMRYVDDIVDGDFPLPDSVSSQVDYVNQRLRFVEKGIYPMDNADYLLLYCQSIAAKLDMSIRVETESILYSMLYDARRIEAAQQLGKGYVCSESELSHHFYELDIDGTVRGMLKIFGDDGDKAYLLRPAGNAHRIKMTLQDLVEDAAAMIINIPAEDFDRYAISSSDLELVASLPKGVDVAINYPYLLPESVARWAGHQVLIGLEAIREQRMLLKTHEFRKTGSFVLNWMYLYPTEQYLRKAEKCLLHTQTGLQ